MGIAGNRTQFHQVSILMLAPDGHGVYGLYDADFNPIYYGEASGAGVTIRSRLLSHCRGDEGRCTQSASYFACELSFAPLYRETELLREHFEIFGRLPRCNQVMPG